MNRKSLHSSTIGKKNYELSNHLGNVLTVISDKPVPHVNGTNIDYWTADIKQATDYSPFGAQLYGRNFTTTKTPVCKDVTTTTNVKVVDDNFTTGGNWTAGSTTTLTYPSGEMQVAATSGLTGKNIGVIKNFNSIGNGVYTVSFKITNNSCFGTRLLPPSVTPMAINVNISLSSGLVIATRSYTATGTYTFTFTSNAPIGTPYSISFVMNGAINCNFRIDDVVISYDKVETKTICNDVADDYRFGFQGQEEDDEIKGEGNSVNYKFRMHDPRLGRFFAIDPLSGEYPYFSTYQFSGNRVVDCIELEGLEPKSMITANGKLTKPVITLMNAAYGFSKSSLGSTTWSSYKNHSKWASLVGIPDGTAASVKGKTVVHDADKNRSDDAWFQLISHEQSHREDVDNNPYFYVDYLFQGCAGYENIGTEKQAYRFGDLNKFGDYADRLLKYQGGIVMSTLDDTEMTKAEKNKIMEKVGKQFYRDAVLGDKLNNLEKKAESLRKEIKNLGGGDSVWEVINWWTLTDSRAMLKATNMEISKVKEEQSAITKEYGQ